MGSELLFRESCVMVAREATYNVDAIDVIIQADGALRREAFTELAATINEEVRAREILRHAFGSNRAQVIGQNVSFQVGGIVPLPATPGNAPLGLNELLVASGMSETVVVDTTSTYALSTTATAGVTIYFYKRHVDDGQWRFTYGTGVRGNMTLTGNVSDWVTFNFVGESANYPYDDAATVPLTGWSESAAYFDATTGLLLLDKNGDPATYVGAETTDDPLGLLLEPSSVITIDGVAFPIGAFTIEFGNNVKQKRVTSATAGVASVWLTGRGMTANFTLRESGPAFNKAKSLLRDKPSAEVAATVAMTDGQGSGGNTVTLTMPKLQVAGVEGPTGDEGLAAWTVPAQLNPDWSSAPADNEFNAVWSVT